VRPPGAWRARRGADPGSPACVALPAPVAYLMFVGLVFVVVNLLTDLVYLMLDPRLRSASAAPAR